MKWSGDKKTVCFWKSDRICIEDYKKYQDVRSISKQILMESVREISAYLIQEEKVMKKYGVNELRQMFLDFMESKGHLVMKSFSLVPQGDKSLLLINAGMAPLKPYFTGAEKPPRTRVTTCQKCIRTGDIESLL